MWAIEVLINYTKTFSLVNMLTGQKIGIIGIQEDGVFESCGIQIAKPKVMRLVLGTEHIHRQCYRSAVLEARLAWKERIKRMLEEHKANGMKISRVRMRVIWVKRVEKNRVKNRKTRNLQIRTTPIRCRHCT